MENKKKSDTDYRLLVKYLTLNKKNLEFIVNLERTIGDIKEDISILTGNKLESIDKKYDDLSVAEYLNIVIIDSLVDKDIITKSTGEKAKKLYFIYLDNEYKKDEIIVSEYGKMDEEYRNSLPNFSKIITDYTIVPELNGKEELHILDEKQENIIFLLKFLSLPKTFYNPDEIIMLERGLDNISKLNGHFFEQNYPLYFNPDEEIAVQDIRKTANTRRLVMTNQFRKKLNNENSSI